MFVGTTLKEQHPITVIQVSIQNKEAILLIVKHDIHSCEIYNKLDTSPNAYPNHNYTIIINEIIHAKVNV